MRTMTRFDRFPTVKRGYDPQAVESHLEELAADMDQTLDEAAAQIAALEGSLEEARSNEEAVHLTILAATQTKQHMLEAAERQAEDLKEEARQKSDQMMTYARMQAFQVVTEARTEAEAIVAEARAEAASIARAEAANTVADDAASEREAALQRRIEEMQAVIEAMEAEIVNSFAGAMAHPKHEDAPNGEPAITEDSEAAVPASDVESDRGRDEETPDEDVASESLPPIAVGAPVEQHLEIIVTDSVPAPIGMGPDAEPDEASEIVDVEMVAEDSTDVVVSADDESVGDRPSGVRRSFYSRRSAKLPRIGVEAGRGAMAAAAGLRPNLSGHEDDGEAVSAPSPEYEAV